MNKAIISAIYKSGEEIFLTNIKNDISFSENKLLAKQFENIQSARSEVSSRFIWLSYWVSKQKNELLGIYINEIDSNNKVIRRDRYL